MGKVRVCSIPDYEQPSAARYGLANFGEFSPLHLQGHRKCYEKSGEISPKLAEVSASE
jgi:hypothetical protein